MSWMNGDGLFVKFGREEGVPAPGGEFAIPDRGRHVIEFTIDYTQVLSATTAILDATGGAGSFGVLIPQGFIPELLDITALVAFTSSGTIGSSTLVIGTKKASDRSTELDHDGLTTASFVASVLDATAENTLVKVGVTGAGDDYGVAYTENGVITVANSAHASHPYTAGVARCRLVGRFGLSGI
jgi:hypothetical protein